MSGDTEPRSDEWTVQTVLAHLLALRADDQRAVAAALTAAEKAVTAALAASEKAIDKADVANEKRLDAVNEFRAQQADLITRFMPRAEAEQVAGALTARFLAANAEINRRIEEQQAQVARLAERMDLREGRSGGLASGWGYLVAGIGAVVLLVNLAIYAVGR